MENKNVKQLFEGISKKMSPKKWKKDQLIIVLLVGILLIVIAIPSGKKSSGKSDNASASGESGDEDASEDGNDVYERKMEKRLSEALSQVAGVGDVRVMITLKSTSEKVVEKDDSSTSNSTREADSEGGTRDTNESTSSRTSVYSEEEDGGQTPYVSKELEPEISGILVIAEGGDNAGTVEDITEAVMALFPVEAHKIKVMKMN